MSCFFGEKGLVVSSLPPPATLRYSRFPERSRYHILRMFPLTYLEPNLDHDSKVEWQRLSSLCPWVYVVQLLGFECCLLFFVLGDSLTHPFTFSSTLWFFYIHISYHILLVVVCTFLFDFRCFGYWWRWQSFLILKMCVGRLQNLRFWIIKEVSCL